MRHLRLALAAAGIVTLASCASSGSAESTSQETAAKSGNPVPSRLKHSDDSIPTAVKAIEVFIERPGALMADVIEIDVSANYDWDVSLTGDEVRPQKADLEKGGHTSVAMGRPRARFRNLDIRAHQRIVFHKSGMDVVPYIKIKAHGQALYVHTPPGNSQPVVRRARAITIANDRIGFLGPENADPRLRAVGVRAGENPGN